MAKAAWSPANGQNHQKWDQKGTERGLEWAQAYRENSQKRDFSKSDSEQFLFRNFYMGRGGSKEPPGGIIYFWAALFPNGALRARPVKRRKRKCFVELARLIVLFRVGLEQLFVVFRLSRFPVGLPQFLLDQW